MPSVASTSLAVNTVGIATANDPTPTLFMKVLRLTRRMPPTSKLHASSHGSRSQSHEIDWCRSQPHLHPHATSVNGAFLPMARTACGTRKFITSAHENDPRRAAPLDSSRSVKWASSSGGCGGPSVSDLRQFQI